MNAEFPEPQPSYFVSETHSLDGGAKVIIHVAGPFDDPDGARRARAAMHEAEPGRMLHCVEATEYE